MSEGGGLWVWFVDSSGDVVTGAFEPPLCSKTTLTGPTPYTHHAVRMPLPYGSPIAPACVTSVRIFAATTGSGNAGTVTFSVPTYVDALETSLPAPPTLDDDVPTSSGSFSTGARVPQISWYHVLARLLPHFERLAHRIGNPGGGAVLCQPGSTLTMPPCASER